MASVLEFDSPAVDAVSVLAPVDCGGRRIPLDRVAPFDHRLTRLAVGDQRIKRRRSIERGDVIAGTILAVLVMVAIGMCWMAL